MRLASGIVDNTTVFGPVLGDELCNVARTGPWSALADMLHAPHDVEHDADIERVVARSPRVAVADVDLLPPVPAPRRVLCVGLNYRSHVSESDQALAAPAGAPVIFTRFASSFVGHRSPVVRPLASSSFDYEGELAVVIGAQVRSVPAELAMSAVAGYSCLMDGTLRDFQRHTSQFTPGKNFDRSGSFGPWIVTADEFDLDAASLSTRVNGETLQHAQISDMLHSIAALVAYCSSFTTLDPGDVIATGTPGGVGYARQPPRWLTAGDRVEVDITGIGVLANDVVDEEPQG